MTTFFQWLVVLASGYQVPEALLNNNQLIDKLFGGGEGTNTARVIKFYLEWHNVLHTDILAVQNVFRIFSRVFAGRLANHHLTGIQLSLTIAPEAPIFS